MKAVDETDANVFDRVGLSFHRVSAQREMRSDGEGERKETTYFGSTRLKIASSVLRSQSSYAVVRLNALMKASLKDEGLYDSSSVEREKERQDRGHLLYRPSRTG